MSNRLTKIYTRTGDDGTTGMADGARLSKSDSRFEAMGKVDMLNSQIGMLRAILHDKQALEIDNELSQIQHQLFNIGGELAMPDYKMLTVEHTLQLEPQIDNWNEGLPPLKDFILPAGSQAVCQVHITRCICRETERVIVGLQERDENIAKDTLSYLNRLSDWLFVLARVISAQDSHALAHEELWQKSLHQS